MTVKAVRSATCVMALFASAMGLAGPHADHIVIFRDPDKYAAFPNLYYDGDRRIWVTFGWNTTRSHYGRLAGGRSGGYRVFSPDLGKTWIRNDQEGYVDIDPELTWLRLSDGTLVRVGVRGWEELTPERVRELEARGIAIRHLKRTDRRVACYRAIVSISTDGGKTWQTRYLAFPERAKLLHGGPAKAIRLHDDTILCPVYGYRKAGEKEPCSWVLRSTDKGKTWELVEAAFDGIHGFSEWAVVEAEPGRVVGLIRTQGMKDVRAPAWEQGYLYQVVSEDGGATWSKAVRTPMWGYPPTLIRLRDGAILASYGYRRPPYGIRACFSYDGGRTWDWKREVILRADALPNGPQPGMSIGDLGYPRSVELQDGTIFTVYYITLGDGVTHIAATRWSRDYIGPADLPRGEDAVPKPDPSLPPEHIIGEVGRLTLVYGVLQMFVPTKPQVAAVAVRVSSESAKYPHKYGLFCTIRKPDEHGNWWARSIASSEVIPPERVKIGGWNLFRFDPPVKVVPGEPYVLTVYNADYLPTPIRLKPGLKGDHWWVLNVGPPDYPNGGLGPSDPRDIGFCVYDTVPERLPSDPR